MRSIFLPLLCIVSLAATGQPDSSRWLRGFPITDYMVDLNDSVRLVQLEMPEDIQLKEKQLGMLWGVYSNGKEETVQKGYGRCQLIKGQYFYFAIGNNSSGFALKKGDLLYTFMDKTPIWYGQVPKLAGHFIRLQNVYEEPFYDRYAVFRSWSEAREKAILDSMITDIRFTGKHFFDTDRSMDKPITKGDYKGKTILQMMMDCTAADLRDFMDYILARPRLYAGLDWKVSEIFATWLSEGAPKVVKGE